jgi:acetyl/propionyl-CoA carboxylase alpha subunit
MIAKISVWGPNRKSALARMRVALDETRVIPPTDSKGIRQGSLQTNLKFLKRLIRNRDLIEGNTPTDLIAKNPDLTKVEAAQDSSLEAEIATALITTIKSQGAYPNSASVQENESTWARAARLEGIHR